MKVYFNPGSPRRFAPRDDVVLSLKKFIHLPETVTLLIFYLGGEGVEVLKLVIVGVQRINRSGHSISLRQVIKFARQIGWILPSA